MLKKVFIWGIALFGMTAISSNVSASAASDVYSVATVAESLEGNYQGNLIRVYMNGEKNPVYGKVANVTDNGDGTVNIHIDSFKKCTIGCFLVVVTRKQPFIHIKKQ